MKIKLPDISKNKKSKKSSNADEATHITFDLTGGSGSADMTPSRAGGSGSTGSHARDNGSNSAAVGAIRTGSGTPAAQDTAGAARIALGRRKGLRLRRAVLDASGRTGGSGSARARDNDSNNATAGARAADAFEVSVRGSDPIIRRTESAAGGRTMQLGGLQVNLATAGILMAMFTLLLAAAYIPEVIPWALPCIAVFMLVTTLESFTRDRIRIYACAAIGVLLVAALIIFHKYIGSGWSLIMNQLYDSAEEAQAYVYNRLVVGDAGTEHPGRSMHLAVLWGSALMGLITALPPEHARRPVAYALAITTMIALAYYGLIPEGICMAILAAALILVMARGHLLSLLPVLLIAMLVFGAIVLIDPGESYTISRADENFRDRFALVSAYLESNDSGYDGLSGFDDELDYGQNDSDDMSDSDAEGRSVWVTVAVVLLIAAAIAAAAVLIVRRLKRRQAANRAGIDSSDPRQAVIAMFPYAVRWLQPAGIEAAGRDFASLTPAIKGDISELYADRYSAMYELWKEAAYSDHDIHDESRAEMKAFLQDTMSMVKSSSNLSKRIVNTFRYAL